MGTWLTAFDTGGRVAYTHIYTIVSSYVGLGLPPMSLLRQEVYEEVI